MPVQKTKVTTIDELLALPEDRMRHELLDGEHVETPIPSPIHQLVLGDLCYALGLAVEDSDTVQVLFSPADIVLGPRTLVQPDLFAFTHETGTIPESWSDVGIPILTIEVISAITASRDRGKKRRIYQDAGVSEYWIVDADSRMIERWTPAEDRPEIFDAVIEWKLPDGSVHGFDVPAIFRSLDPDSGKSCALIRDYKPSG